MMKMAQQGDVGNKGRHVNNVNKTQRNQSRPFFVHMVDSILKINIFLILLISINMDIFNL